ncbi:hypothetical protein [Alistipes indistinctus]|uniref:hypothetical protein n=1 Tax=Alistipes indistinctus TaxID=626932 RepID=UPI00242EC903|nr:hypothetical protein [Alistipes indistinctus]
MKKYGFVILLLCLVGFSFVPVYGQIGIPSHSIVNPDSVSHNFYERETVKGNTITYKIDHSYPMLYRIGNASNTRLGELMSLKDGSTPTEPVDRGGDLDVVSLEPVYRAFLETFTPEEIRVLAQNNEVLLVGYALSESGSVLEVDFSMYRNRPHLYNIPPQYLEKLEAKLKSTVHYVIPEYKRQQLCKYNVITVSQVFPFKSLLDKL